jgi:hypothetical protein
MSGQITLTLRDEVLRRAERISRDTGRPVAELLAEAIDASFNPLGPLSEAMPPVRDLPDDVLLAVADSMMPDPLGGRLNELLARQRENLLSPAERAELMALNQAHNVGLVRKSQAIAEAVRRGLRGPPRP